MLETVKIGVWETPERFRCHAVFTAWHLNLFVNLEQGTGVEPALTAWEAAVIPIYQPCERCYYSRSAGVLQPKILSRA